jgi:hypothetical protein
MAQKGLQLHFKSDLHRPEQMTKQVSALYRSVLIFAVLLPLVWTQGCYHYRVIVPQPTPATEYEKKTSHALFWGLVQDETITNNCVSNTLDEVRVTTNMGYVLVSVLTLGIWVPLEVEWRCAKAPPRVEEF